MTAIILSGALCGTGVLLLVLALQQPAARGSGAVSALARLDHDLARSRGEQRDRASDRSGAGPAARSARLERLGRGRRRPLDRRASPCRARCCRTST